VLRNYGGNESGSIPFRSALYLKRRSVKVIYLTAVISAFGLYCPLLYLVGHKLGHFV
jgi:hypothetical protein